ncbi:Uncharacterised protein [Serratia proteamaculans]|jgi:hypothetical protein|nr:Uncharacterised protein [Serratia entomophila]CAI1720396.1 Uncharacterised protein [Serratia proteamaculans]CAI1732582.1 Uncharacterised protein [Serratia entomophila]CAI2439832.1 Uncharacterised protein [Serratia marcescens]
MPLVLVNYYYLLTISQWSSHSKYLVELSLDA